MENIESNVEVIEYNVQQIEEYQTLIDEFKTRLAIDKGTLSEDVKDLIMEVKQEIISLKIGIENLQTENEEIFQDNCTMAKQLYINEQLLKVKSKKTRKRIKELLLKYDTDVRFIDMEHIDNIFNLVLGDAANND